MFTVIIASEKARALLDEYESLFTPFLREGRLAICNWRAGLTENNSFDEVLPGLRQIIRGKEKWRAVVVGVESDNVGFRTVRENPFDFAWDNRVSPPCVKEAVQPQVMVTHLLMGYPQTAPEFRPYVSYAIDREVELHHCVKAGLAYDLDELNLRVRSVRDYTGADKDADHMEILFEGDVRPQLSVNKDMFQSKAMEQQDLLDQYIQATNENAPKAEGNALAAEEIEFFLIDSQIQWGSSLRKFEIKPPRYSNDKQRLRQLQEQYKSGEILPDEITCMQTRLSYDKQCYGIRDSWETKIEEQRSNFVDRNNYPPETRFICFDMVPENISSYNRSCFNYCLCALSVALARIPASYFQAYHLYEVQVDLDVKELVEEYSALHGVVVDVIENIAQHLRAAPALQFRATELLTNTEVPMEMERLNVVPLKLPPVKPGLVKDKPRPGELAKWRSAMAGAQRQIERFDRLPKRILARSVATMHDQCDSFPADEYELDIFDIDELEAAAGSLRQELAEKQNSMAFDRKAVLGKLEEADARITSFIRTRLDSSRALSGLGVMALAIVLTLLPFLIDALMRGGLVALTGIVVPVIVIIGVAAGLVLALWSSKRKLRRLLKNVENMLQAAANNTVERLGFLRAFLGRIATLTNARNMLSGASDERGQRRLRLRKLYGAQLKLKTLREKIADLLNSYGSEVHSMPIRPYVLNYENPDAVFGSELLELPHTRNKMALNWTGERISAPYAFIERLSIERSLIFEPNFEDIEKAERRTQEQNSQGPTTEGGEL